MHASEWMLYQGSGLTGWGLAPQLPLMNSIRLMELPSCRASLDAEFFPPISQAHADLKIRTSCTTVALGGQDWHRQIMPTVAYNTRSSNEAHRPPAWYGC
jgi:hypothetical protein